MGGGGSGGREWDRGELRYRVVGGMGLGRG